MDISEITSVTLDSDGEMYSINNGQYYVANGQGVIDIDVVLAWLTQESLPIPAFSSVALFEEADASVYGINETFDSEFYVARHNVYAGDPSGINDSDYILVYNTRTPDTEFTSTSGSFTNIPEYVSYEMKGYFLCKESGTYTFYVSSDDFSYAWIGAKAVSEWNVSNASINNGGLHGEIEVSVDIPMKSGSYYPIRVQGGNNTGVGSVVFSYSSDSGIDKTTNFAGHVFSNPNVGF